MFGQPRIRPARLVCLAATSMDPTNESDWRVAESRRMIADARALVSIARSLSPVARSRDGTDGDILADTPRASPGVVLIHAVSLPSEDVAYRSASGRHSTAPIFVLLNDAPTFPEFLPEDIEVDMDDPTEGSLQSAIERHVREALGRSPSENHILDLVESIQDGVIVIDRHRTVVYLNPGATALLQTLTGRTGPFVGQPLARAFPPALSPTLRPAIFDALVHGEASHVSEPERHRGLALDVALFPHPHGATLLVRDGTERRDIEAELIETRVSLARAESRLRARDDEASA